MYCLHFVNISMMTTLFNSLGTASVLRTALNSSRIFFRTISTPPFIIFTTIVSSPGPLLLFMQHQHNSMKWRSNDRLSDIEHVTQQKDSIGFACYRSAISREVIVNSFTRKLRMDKFLEIEPDRSVYFSRSFHLSTFWNPRSSDLPGPAAPS